MNYFEDQGQKVIVCNSMFPKDSCNYRWGFRKWRGNEDVIVTSGLILSWVCSCHLRGEVWLEGWVKSVSILTHLMLLSASYLPCLLCHVPFPCHLGLEPLSVKIKLSSKKLWLSLLCASKEKVTKTSNIVLNNIHHFSLHNI